MDAGRAQPGGRRDLADGEPLLMGGHDGPDPLLLGRTQAHDGPVQALREVACALHPLAPCLCCLHSCDDTRAPAHLSSKLNALTSLSVPLLVLPRVAASALTTTTMRLHPTVMMTCGLTSSAA